MKFRHILTLLIALGVAVLLFLPASSQAASLPGLHDTCLQSKLKGCTVLSSGYVTLANGTQIAFQTQDGFTEEDGVSNGVVLFEASEGADWTLFASAFDGFGYTVHVVEHDETMLHVSGFSGGSGAFNMDMLFIWGDLGHAVSRDGWVQIDMDQWFANIATMLPEGLEIWKGVDYDFDDWFYNALEARTYLWASGDGNCCPTGGQAIIHFAIEDHALVATSVDYLPPAKTK